MKGSNMGKFSMLKICLSSAATVGLVVGAASPAAAQDRSSEENAQQGQPSSASEIIVTARKRSERLSDVPETITAFSSEALTKAGIANVDDIGRQLPNVVLNRRGDKRGR